MNSKGFSVVNYPDGVMAVPNSWVSPNKKTAFFPPFDLTIQKNVNKVERFIKQSEPPKEDWTREPVKFFNTYGI